MNLNNWRIASRLGLGFGSVLALLIAVTVVTVLQFGGFVRDLNAISDMDQRTVKVMEWASSTRLNVNRVMAIARSHNAPAVEAHFSPLMAETTEKINELQKQLESDIQSEDGKALLAQVAQLRADYIAARKAFFAAIKASQESANATAVDGADATPVAPDFAAADGLLNTRVLPAANAYMAAQDDMVKLGRGFMDEYKAHALSETGTSKLFVILLALGAVGVGAGVSVAISRSIVRPVRDAVDFAEAIAHGDLTRHIATTRQDELGELLRALAEMKDGLLRVVGQIRHTSDSIGVASTEIAAGNQDLSSRTEQTASSLEQTASSMEQLTATVRQSAEAAGQAAQLAASAAAVAQRGGTVVGQVVHTMDDISQSSQKISDIIGVIDGIAFQTNILALNAAVEAARAGEQGRGFAVVAGEVRTLAQRSAQAAKEIKDLINASVEKVQGGSRLVQDAGDTMGEIVSGVQRVSHIIGEISAAAAEQRDGIGQVNVAISQLDQMTQQNAALVEESAAAAESLRDQSTQLTQAISVFRTGDAAAPPPRTAPQQVAIASNERAPTGSINTGRAPKAPGESAWESF